MPELPYQLQGPGGQFNDIVGGFLSGGTIAPDKMVHHINNTTAIATITPPHEGYTGPLYLVADSQFTAVSTGNIALAITTTVASKVYVLIYDRKTAKWYPVNP
jgi:hypothetical protein